MDAELLAHGAGRDRSSTWSSLLVDGPSDLGSTIWFSARSSMEMERMWCSPPVRALTTCNDYRLSTKRHRQDLWDDLFQMGVGQHTLAFAQKRSRLRWILVCRVFTAAISQRLRRGQQRRSHSGSGGTPPGNYSITVMGRSGSLQRVGQG